MKNRRNIIISGVVVAVAVAVFVAVWFQPQKLWIDEQVDEAAPAPVVSSTTAGTSVPTTSPRAGTFRPLDHDASGSVVLLAATTGHVVRLEHLDVENGPDLHVYLSAADPSSVDDAVFDDDFVSLGKLKGNQGSQNYEVPQGVDPSRYRSAVIWCKRFSTGFAVAPLA